ncbi:hypothetical protein RJ640_025488 [Escallonia rubra]|uniref:Annexin n=1 Tax=Escallonia rubra TaxID=112253 RepID=A0AA88RBW1_9ASTE|nr:hypothetical protein RJ640_025488 [Escallonia rubra]
MEEEGKQKPKKRNDKRNGKSKRKRKSKSRLSFLFAWDCFSPRRNNWGNRRMATLGVPDVVPSPAQDSQTLKKAFQGTSLSSSLVFSFWVLCLIRSKMGWGTDEKAIIKVLGRRNAGQRRKIKETYQQLYNESLIHALQSELSGDFGKAVILWTSDPPERDARLANEALKSRRKGINQVQVIVELACAYSPHHLVAVRQAYCSLFDCSLEEDIILYVDLPVRKILVGLVRSYRYDKEVVDSDVAEAEAAMLHEAIEAKQLDHDNVVLILGTRNIFQLKLTFECYKQNYGNHIDQPFHFKQNFQQDVESCGNGILESVLRVVIWCIDSPEKHFAEVIRASIVGLGTDEDSLTRAIVSRAEIDMVKIRGEYYEVNKTSLEDAVIGDTSGDYKAFLMTLLGATL